MKNRFVRFALFFSGLLLLASCGSLPELQKRKYRDGFYFHKSGTEERKENPVKDVAVEKQIVPANAPETKTEMIVCEKPPVVCPVADSGHEEKKHAAQAQTISRKPGVPEKITQDKAPALRNVAARPDYVLDQAKLCLLALLLLLGAAAIVWGALLGMGIVLLIFLVLAGLVLASAGLVTGFMHLNNTARSYKGLWIATTVLLGLELLLLLPCTLVMCLLLFGWSRKG